ncbi:MAG: hypothetical protein AB1728_01250 [Bacteroidota bacterium]
MEFFKKYKVEDIKIHLTREEIIRRSRILIIDDERPDLIDDLKKAGFAVDYEQDITKENMKILENPLYDLILLDYGNVGKSFGQDQGLSLLRFIKRVNPALVVYTYTSKALDSNQADFYRLTDGVLSKDAGIAESLEKIEEGLRRAHSLPNIWKALMQVADIKINSEEDKDLQDLYVRGLNSKKKLQRLKSRLSHVLNSDVTQKIGFALLEKAIELGIKSFLGA